MKLEPIYKEEDHDSYKYYNVQFPDSMPLEEQLKVKNLLTDLFNTLENKIRKQNKVISEIEFPTNYSKEATNFCCRLKLEPKDKYEANN